MGGALAVPQAEEAILIIIGPLVTIGHILNFRPRA
jgi:hypothetical protein